MCGWGGGQFFAALLNNKVGVGGGGAFVLCASFVFDSTVNKIKISFSIFVSLR